MSYEHTNSPPIIKEQIKREVLSTWHVKQGIMPDVLLSGIYYGGISGNKELNEITINKNVHNNQ